jgi:hypothetical protein
MADLIAIGNDDTTTSIEARPDLADTPRKEVR